MRRKNTNNGKTMTKRREIERGREEKNRKILRKRNNVCKQTEIERDGERWREIEREIEREMERDGEKTEVDEDRCLCTA